MSIHIRQPESPQPVAPTPFNPIDCNRLEGITVCVDFPDLLDIALTLNHPHYDHFIVVTSHEDWRTQAVARKHGATVVPTDLNRKNGRKFNKGAMINAGFAYFQYDGLRNHIDADIVVPDNYRRVLLNHTHIENDCLYGADRLDVIGPKRISELQKHFGKHPQNRLQFLIDPTHDRELEGPIGGRIVGNLEGYTPLGFFQLWHASQQKQYPWSKGTAAHDAVMFARLWPLAKRRHLPSVFCYHLCPDKPKWGENWEGRKSARLS